MPEMFPTAAKTTTPPQQVASGAFFAPRIAAPPNMIQKTEEQTTGKAANPLGDLIAKQLSDKEFKKHIVSLGEALQALALEATDPTKNPGAGSSQPVDSQARFTALHIKFLFENQAEKILGDPALKGFREQFSGVVKESPATALAVALTGLMVAYLANIGLKIPKIEEKIGAGFSVGGSADVGKAQKPDMKHADVFVKFAQGLFSVKAQGGVDKSKEGELVGFGKGEIKVGSKDASATAAIQVDTEKKWTLTGRLSADILGQKDLDFVLYTDVKWPIGTQGATLKPGLSGTLKFGPKHRLLFGTQAQVSTLSGLKGLEGFVEYQNGLMRIRLDGNLNGIKNENSLTPGQDMRIQATVIVPLSVFGL